MHAAGCRLTLGEHASGLDDAARALFRARARQSVADLRLERARPYARADRVCGDRRGHGVAIGRDNSAPPRGAEERPTRSRCGRSPRRCRMEPRGFKLDRRGARATDRRSHEEHLEASDEYREACRAGGHEGLASAIPTTAAQKGCCLQTLLTERRDQLLAQNREIRGRSHPAHRPHARLAITCRSWRWSSSPASPSWWRRSAPGWRCWRQRRPDASMATTGWRPPRLAARAAPAPMCSRLRRTPVSARCSSRSRAMFSSVADYSSMEMRAAANISGDVALREAFENGLDPHKITAMRMTGKIVGRSDGGGPQGGQGGEFRLDLRAGRRRPGQERLGEFQPRPESWPRPGPGWTHSRPPIRNWCGGGASTTSAVRSAATS